MSQDTEQQVALVRAFNRVYTRRLGLLHAHLRDSVFTLSEARILYEIVNRDCPTAAEIARALDLDRGQMSRTLKRLGDQGVVETRDDPSHGRHQLLSLTASGRAAYAALEASTQEAVRSLLNSLPLIQRQQFLDAAATISRVFDVNAQPEVTFRSLKAGDLGLIVHRQAVLYRDDYGYNESYEGLIAQIVADFRQAFDPARDDAWVAEMHGQMVGSIFLVHTDDPQVAKLRLLYVEPDARGLGIGKSLVETCIARARALGYGRLDLWTDNVLAAARRVYQRAGFKLVDEAPAPFFGTESMSQTWSLMLGDEIPTSAAQKR
ncbi:MULTISPECIES: helix-turn-helix domain-containing GNAT family N-acetyltransferase [unclassified Novosphingobium]|uniref:bifunctional helix-turn-helix transcriptional regulator/GNAT family N-acetyltransferase n=1 Tax=unclassified Novosphingobium TaxID=2644732 RepID=UPI00146B0AAF|nr:MULTISPECIES: helix-turn-helix domain-containing GNAT family N-acetyltransferase [unclassified Novosphingobium]NMN03041.1 DNA-binding MarR family transcriptional regulator/GNAT superfamily N-acetyltransferase [Novosphingobium sp. SG919]NMN86971.1 DNA-binding MarR family transcriptional regulator/GNAT superfamily N-acetyltransferase [Novosphingobium sp. SG916]